LQALDESIIGREWGGIEHRGRSLISATALLSMLAVLAAMLWDKQM